MEALIASGKSLDDGYRSWRVRSVTYTLDTAAAHAIMLRKTLQEIHHQKLPDSAIAAQMDEQGRAM